LTPIEWINSLVKRHGLERPDGRPLYQYRVTDDEYIELTKTLKLSAMLGVNNVVNLLSWDAAFVIYASEWWRREYDGQWGWSGLFEAVDINYKDLTVGKRNALIESGLQRWRREIRSNNGIRQLLGTIATEGGLPLHQLADSGGWLENILKPVLKKHVSREISVSLLIENYQSLIPKSYRSEEINQILADIIKSVVHLRQTHQLMDKERPLKWLDEKQPDWRELFPIPIDNESGRTLLRGLVDVASKVKKEVDTKNPFEVERHLVHVESANPELIALLEMPTFVSLESISLDAEISSALHVEVYEPNGNTWPWCRAYLTTQGDKQLLKLSGRTIKIDGSYAASELKVRFKSLGKVIHECEPINGQSLDCDLPSLFKNIDGRWMLYGSASQSIESDNALVYIPNSFSCKPANELTNINKTGSIFSGNLHELKGTIYCHFEDDQYRFSTDSQESLLQYKLSGKRFTYGSNPGDVYIGAPDLHETNLISGASSKKHEGILVAKPIGTGGQWVNLSQVGTGCYEVRHKDNDGNILLRRRIGILPKEFSYHLLAGDQPGKGNIQFTGISNCQFSINAENIKTRIDYDNSKADIQLSSTGLPPMFINVSLSPTNHHKEILLNFPYPSKGALLFDPTEKHIEFSNHLFLSDLQGYRIKVYSSNTRTSNNIDLRFSLIDSEISTESLRDIYIQKRVELDVGVTEFSIYDWIEPISNLMGVSSSLDSSVEISMLSQGQELFNLKIYRYEKEVIPDWDNGIIKLETNALLAASYDTLEGTQLCALCLNQPEQESIQLEHKTTGGAVMGEWIFPIERLKAGPWLVYPTENSKLKFRPLVWNVGDYIDPEDDDCANIDSLPKAIRIKDQNLREQPIRDVLRMMAADLNHKSWDYINNLWVKTAHLPIVTFDIWKLAISEPKFLACLLIQGNEGIITRLEAELPVHWELVHLSVWEASILTYKDKITESLGDEEIDLIRTLVEKKITGIESLSDSMLSIGKILRFKIFGETSPELQALQLPVSVYLEDWLENEFQHQIKQGGNWPEVLNELIALRCSELPRSYSELLTKKLENQFQLSIVLLPMLLAWRATETNNYDWPNDAVELFKIDLLKSFNEDWFNAVFQLLSGWLSQNKIEAK
jgi:hypothetical protein